MKKYYIIIFILIFILCIPAKTDFTVVAGEYECGEYYFYVEGREEKGQFTSSIPNGNTTILRCPIYTAELLKTNIKGKILGESFVVPYSKIELNSLVKKLGAKVVSEGEVDGIYSVYLYAGGVDAEPINLFGNKVNMQIAVTNGKMHVGFPILLGSY